MMRDAFVAFDEYVDQPDVTSSDALAARLAYYDSIALEAIVDTTPAGSGTGMLTVDVLHSGDGITWLVAKAGAISGTIHRDSTDALFGYVDTASTTLPMLDLVRLRVNLTGSITAAHVRIFANLRDPSD
jgi:hypothetical protein